MVFVVTRISTHRTHHPAKTKAKTCQRRGNAVSTTDVRFFFFLNPRLWYRTVKMLAYCIVTAANRQNLLVLAIINSIRIQRCRKAQLQLLVTTLSCLSRLSDMTRILGMLYSTVLRPRGSVAPTDTSPLPYLLRTRHYSVLSLHEQTAPSSMSHAHPTVSSSSSSSSNFQLIINNALDIYKKRTKNDLLAHPLAAQLQSCDSPSAILAILHQQVQELDYSQSGDERWSRWLEPTVNVLYALSSSLGEGVGLVCAMT